MHQMPECRLWYKLKETLEMYACLGDIKFRKIQRDEKSVTQIFSDFLTSVRSEAFFFSSPRIWSKLKQSLWMF
jgi:hypothetical protein